MSGAIIAPALPAIDQFFEEENDILTRLVLTMPALSIALLAQPTGMLADKFGRKRLLISALIVYAIAGVAGFFISNLYVLLASRAILGVAVAGAMTAATTLIGDYFSGNERNQFMGIQAGFMSLGAVVFLNLGGVLADWNWRGPFLIYGFALLILPMAVAYLFEPAIDKGKQHSPGDGATNQTIWFVYFIGMIGMIFFYMIPVQIPFLLSANPSVSNAWIGMAISIATVTGSISGLAFGKVKSKFSFVQIYVFIFLMMALGYLVISSSSNYWIVVIGLGIVGLGSGLLVPASSICLITTSPEATRGRAIGGLTAAIFLGQFLSPIVVNPIVAATSINDAYWIAAIVMIPIAFLPYLFFKRLDEKRTKAT